jgi:fermentation-respiration switch protein FrsA (DUF1100 family)
MVSIVAGLLGVYVVLVALLWAFQEKLTFPAPRAALPSLPSGERVELTMRDGTRLAGWFWAAEGEAAAAKGGEGVERRQRPALLWFYGNGENIAAIWPIIRDFRPPQAALLVVDYPGYGASGGRASEAGMYEAADLAYDAVRGRSGVDPRRIYAYGRSLGSAAATHIASTREIAGLILESPFTSARGMAARHYRFVPRALVRLELDNLGRMPRIRVPTLIFHGTADRLVPMRMGQELAAAAGGPVELVMIEGSGHNDTYDLGGRRYRDKLAAFVK